MDDGGIAGGVEIDGWMVSYHVFDRGLEQRKK